MSPHRGVSPHGAQHPPGPLDTTPSMSDRLFRLGLAESQVRKNVQMCISKLYLSFVFRSKWVFVAVNVSTVWSRQCRLPRLRKGQIFSNFKQCFLPLVFFILQMLWFNAFDNELHRLVRIAFKAWGRPCRQQVIKSDWNIQSRCLLFEKRNWCNVILGQDFPLLPHYLALVQASLSFSDLFRHFLKLILNPYVEYTGPRDFEFKWSIETHFKAHIYVEYIGPGEGESFPILTDYPWFHGTLSRSEAAAMVYFAKLSSDSYLGFAICIP